MNTEIGLGISTKLDSFSAGKEAANSAFYQLIRKEPDILIVFISTIFDQLEVIKGIRSIIKEAPLVGCSTVGSITHYGVFRNSVTVCAIRSVDISFSCGIGNNISKSPRLAGMNAAKEASRLEHSVRQVYTMFFDNLSGNGTTVLRGTQEVLGTSFPVIGGSSTDELEFQKTYQYFNSHIYTDAVVGLLIGGNVKVGVGKAHGWHPIGMPHKITRARYNIIREIDKKRAIELYEEYMGKSLDQLNIEGIAKLGCSYPLGIEMKEKKEFLTRTPLKIEETGGLMLTAEIPEREYINLMIGDRNLALEATKRSCTEALNSIKEPNVKFAMVFSDIARFQLFRTDLYKEVEIIKNTIGKDVPFFGCYTYGEYAPEESKRQSYFYNQVISTAIFSE